MFLQRLVPLSVGSLLSSKTSLQSVTGAANEANDSSVDILKHTHDVGVNTSQ